jgi:hypothetical protein
MLAIHQISEGSRLNLLAGLSQRRIPQVGMTLSIALPRTKAGTLLTPIPFASEPLLDDLKDMKHQTNRLDGNKIKTTKENPTNNIN